MSSKEQARPVEYYLDLRYPMVVKELSPEDGSGYVATIPQLGSRTFVADGETAGEAIKALEVLRRRLIPELLAEGVEMPEPDEQPGAVEQYSGNLVLRIPKSLHAQLATEARRNGCSLNKYATHLLSQNLERERWIDQLRELSERLEAATAVHIQSVPEPVGSGLS